MLLSKQQSALIDKNKLRIEMYFRDVWSMGNLDLLDEIITDDYIYGN